MYRLSGTAFFKLEALANDFVLVDARERPGPGGPAFDPNPEEIAALADRRTGIGFDQLLILHPGSPAVVAIRNADGSGAEQCGNGMRAIAAWLDRRGELADGTELLTPAGPVRLGTSLEHGYLADLPGPTSLSADALGLPPPTLPTGVESSWLVSLGNPHLIVRWPREPTPAALAELVETVERTPGWAGRVNIGLLYPESGRSAALLVHERGSGPTRACGSAACAAARALAAAHEVAIRQPGGTLVVDLHTRPGRAVTSGPATVVFEGIIA